MDGDYTKPQNAVERRKRDSDTVELRRAGHSWSTIVERLKFTGQSQAESAYARGLAMVGWATIDFASVAEAEMDRLNRLQQVVWNDAVVKKSPAAIDRASRLSMDRIKIAAYASKLAAPKIITTPPSEEQPVQEDDDLADFRQRHHGSA